MTRTLTAVTALAFALGGGCGKKQDEGKAEPPAPQTRAEAPPPPAADAPPPVAEPPKPPARTPITDGPVTLLSAATTDLAIATWKQGDIELELFAERAGEDAGKGTIAARVSARIEGKVSELHVCGELYTATGGRAYVQLDAAGALYVVCNTRATAQNPDWFAGIRLVWNAEDGILEKAGEFESEQVFDPDTMDFGE